MSLSQESGVQSSDDASLAAMLIADLPEQGAKTYEDKLEMARSIAGMSYLGKCIFNRGRYVALIIDLAGIDTVGAQLDFHL